MATITEGARVVLRGDATSLVGSFAQGLKSARAFQVGAVAALGAVTVASVKMAASADKNIRLVGTLTNATTEEMKRMKREVSSLAREFGRDFNSIAQANYQAVSGGFREINKSMAVTRAGIELSIAGNADLVGSTELVMKTLNAFRRDADDAAKTAAGLWAITRDGVVTVEQLNRFMRDLPLTVSATGFQFEELAAAFATMTAPGGDAAATVDQLRSAIIKMEQEGFTGTLQERIERFVGKGIGELTDMLKDQTAARGMLVLSQNTDMFAENLAKAQRVLPDFNKALDSMQGSAEQTSERIRQELNETMRELGDTLLPTVNRGMELFLLLWRQVISRPSRSKPSGAPGDEGLAPFGEGGILPDPFTGAGGLPPRPGSGGGRTPPPTPRPGPVPVIVSNAAELSAGLRDIRPALGPIGIGGPLPPGGLGGSALDFLMGRGQFNESQQRALIGFGGIGGPSFGPPTDRDLKRDQRGPLGEAGGFDEEVQRGAASMALASGAAAAMSSTMFELVGALDLGDSAFGRILSTFLNAGLSSLSGGLFGNIFGFQHGGFTGPGGQVHANEFVFSAEAVRNMGIGALERAHSIAQAGGGATFGDINITVGSGDPTDVASAVERGVGAALRRQRETGSHRLTRAATLGA